MQKLSQEFEKKIQQRNVLELELNEYMKYIVGQNHRTYAQNDGKVVI